MILFPVLLLLAAQIQPEPNGPAYRQPQLAVGHGQVALTFGAERAIYFSSSTDRGGSFSPPVKVAAVEVLALGRHRGPRVTILKDAILVSAIVGEKISTAPHAHGLPADGNITVWRSEDHGKTWSRSGIVNDVPGAAREGFHAISQDPTGCLTAVWLDLRGQGTQLYSSRSTVGGRSWSKTVLVYASPAGTICQCCAPSLAIDPKGRAVVMWRNVLDGARDLYLASAEGKAFGPARKLGTGTWKLDACPMDGGALGFDHGRLTSVWRREGDVYRAEPGRPEQRIGTGKDIAAASTPSGLYVAWSKGEGLEILVPHASAPVPLAAQGAFVNLAALPNGSVLAVWEANGSIVIEPVTSGAKPSAMHVGQLRYIFLDLISRNSQIALAAARQVP